MNPHMLPYIAGLIDGEGCITLNIGQKNRSIKVSPKFSIAMKKGKWSEVFVQTLNEIGVPYSTRHRFGWQTEIDVKGWHNVHKLLKALRDFLVVKKDLADKILEASPRTHKIRFAVKMNDDTRRTAELIDYVRAYNRAKNTPYKWTGQKFLEFYAQLLPP